MTRALFLAATLVSAWLLWESFPRVDVEAARDESAAVPRATPLPVRAPEPRPDRNLFVYEQETELLDAPGPAPLALPPAATLEPAVPPEPQLRLLGLLSEGGRPRALVSIEGETALVGAGESLRGYAVVSIGDDVVRLRHPERGEIALELPD
jgi:hypothetical protein